MTMLNQTHSGEAQSKWMCSDPNTSDPQYEGDQRGADRQTARLTPCLSCQNRQAAKRNTQEYPSFKPFLHLPVLQFVKFYFSQMLFFFVHQSFFLSTNCAH